MVNRLSIQGISKFARYTVLPLCCVLLAMLFAAAPGLNTGSRTATHILTHEGSALAPIEGVNQVKSLHEKDACQVLLIHDFTPTVSSQLAIANFSPSHEIFLRLPLALVYSQTVSSRL